MKTLSESNQDKDKPQSPTPEKEDRPVVNSTTKKEESSKSETPDRPITAEYFDVPDWGSILLEPKMDAHRMYDKVVFIDDYISEQLRKSALKSGKESVFDILADIENSLGLTSKHDVTHRLSRVYGFLSVIKMAKEREAEREKRLMSILKK